MILLFKRSSRLFKLNQQVFTRENTKEKIVQNRAKVMAVINTGLKFVGGRGQVSFIQSVVFSSIT